jgi:hypothetical protein
MLNTFFLLAGKIIFYKKNTTKYCVGRNLNPAEEAQPICGAPAFFRIQLVWIRVQALNKPLSQKMGSCQDFSIKRHTL